VESAPPPPQAARHSAAAKGRSLGAFIPSP
jgi:hypothetical protein